MLRSPVIPRRSNSLHHGTKEHVSEIKKKGLQGKDILHIDKENQCMSNIKSDTSMYHQKDQSLQASNPFKAGRSLQRTPPKSNQTKHEVPYLPKPFGDACINLSQNLDSESCPPVAPIEPAQPQSKPKALGQPCQVGSNLTESLTSTEYSSNSELDVIELQLKLSNELLEKYQLQEEMIRLRQQLREKQTNNLDVNIAKINEINEQRSKRVTLQPEAVTNHNNSERPLPHVSSPIPGQPDHELEIEKATKSPLIFGESLDHSTLPSPVCRRTPTPPPKKRGSRKHVEKRAPSPELYVDVGAPFLIPKGMSFIPLKSNASGKLVGHVPKSPSTQKQCDGVDDSPMKKPKQPKRKKPVISPTKDDSTPSKSPPSKKSTKSKKVISEEPKSIGYSLFCESIRQDAEKIILDSKPSGKGKKKCSASELEELFCKMWGVLSKREKAGWDEMKAPVLPAEDEQECIAPLSNEEIFKSTTSTQKTKKNSGKPTRASKKVDPEITGKKTRKKKVLLDPTEELFDRVENTSLCSTPDRYEAPPITSPLDLKKLTKKSNPVGIPKLKSRNNKA